MINYPLGFAGTVDVLSIDHDLGDGMSGYDTIKKIVNDYPSILDNIDEICIHSNNTVGRENIKQYLINAQENNVISSSLKIYPNYLQYNDGCLYDTVTGEKLYQNCIVNGIQVAISYIDKPMLIVNNRLNC